jgi:hemolysin type calcium binding protein/hemolysin type calcium-binding protein
VNLMVNVTATGHQINIDEQYWSATANWGVEQFRFANGTVWNRDTIMQNAWWNGTGGNDTMSGWGSFDNIDGGGGNDTINGNAGIDRIVGGSGNDSLTGGAASDTFIFKSGFGLDTTPSPTSRRVPAATT